MHHMLNVAWMGAGFGYHFDPSDAIILQVEGNKQGPQTLQFSSFCMLWL